MDFETQLEHLKRQLEEAQQRADEAEQERQRAEQERQRERERADEAEQESRKTTLAEYIRGCHELIFTKFTVEPNESRTSKGSITNPRNKLCPTRLEPWSDFFEQQRSIFEELYTTFPGQKEVFENRAFMRGLGDRVARKRVADEKGLEYVQHTSVEEPVTLVVEHLRDEDGAETAFNIGGGIVFENHPNAISDVAEEPTERRTAQLPPRTPGNPRLDHNQLRPDQICVYKRDDDDSTGRRMAYVIEYKAPHKLTPPHLRLGLRRMNIYRDVVNRATKPTTEDAEALFQYHADRLAAAAVTQTFHYMIEAGLEYGYLTTGEAIVFLKVDWARPTTLYYHLAEPGPEVDAHPDDLIYCTAVGQVLAFTLLAFRSHEHGQDERQLAINGLKTWTEDCESILRSIPVSERSAPPTSPAYKPRTYKDVVRSPYDFRRRCRPDDSSSARNRSPERSDDEPGTRMPDTPTPAGTRSRGQRGRLARRPRGDSGQGSSSRDGGGRNHRYCTQKCLLGLLSGKPLDEQCPNVSLHRRQGSGLHPINHAAWLGLLREQLRQTLDRGVVRLGKQGARGVLFKITLLDYGYTFVSKGTVPEFVEDLEHEAAVYGRLRRLQGVCVPVFLGAVDLRDVGRTYYYDFRVRIVHMMFLSWAGDSLDVAGASEDVRRGLLRTVRALHARGVAHGDVRTANALWNDETRRVMLVDFERAVLADPPRPALAPVVPNRRAWPVGQADTGKPIGRLGTGNGLNPQRLMQDDILAAKREF